MARERTDSSSIQTQWRLTQHICLCRKQQQTKGGTLDQPSIPKFLQPFVCLFSKDNEMNSSTSFEQISWYWVINSEQTLRLNNWRPRISDWGENGVRKEVVSVLLESHWAAAAAGSNVYIAVVIFLFSLSVSRGKEIKYTLITRPDSNEPDALSFCYLGDIQFCGKRFYLMPYEITTSRTQL